MTYQPTLCVITPTIGRPTLRRTLESGRLGTEDLWYVITDGPNEDVSKLCDVLETKHAPLECIEMPKSGDYGNKQRDLAIRLSSDGPEIFFDYFIFLDDDDIFTPGAVEVIKRETAKHYPRPIMFKMINGNGETLWRNHEVTPGNVGGSMFCCPNIPGKLGVWANGAGHRSDFEFMMGTLKKYGPGWRQHLVWSDEVIIHCRPEA